jgi:predicted DNA-binding transcriptional regulator AlpA
MENHINLVNVPLDVMTSTIREIVSSELQKAKDLFIEAPKVGMEPKLTRKQVCALLGVCEATLYNYNKNKILVNFKVGRKVHYRESDVMALFNNLKTLN